VILKGAVGGGALESDEAFGGVGEALVVEMRLWCVDLVHVDNAVGFADFGNHVLVGGEREVQRFGGTFDEL